MKEQVKGYWEKVPCGAGDVASLEEGSLEFFESVERQRYSGDRFMHDVVGFGAWKGKKVLEVGCGLGTDLLQFARGGAQTYGIDLTEKGALLTRRRLGLYGHSGQILVGDAENLPFRSDYFDLVYSWGVIHHTPDTGRAAREIVRVCRPGGSVLVMLYHRRSLLALQSWVVYGLMRGKPTQPVGEIIAEHVESPGTKSYTPAEAVKLFDGLSDIAVRRIVTRYDMRIGRRHFLPGWTRSLVPSSLGWFMVVTGSKK
ncbi:MAG TPA: class I SAM-dependent methyltransferase [Pyrinomonadaceae bacterium]|nr:class I SAM-dependent methyltransferase [Pyrinomonadaceae bacterium]